MRYRNKKKKKISLKKREKVSLTKNKNNEPIIIENGWKPKEGDYDLKALVRYRDGRLVCVGAANTDEILVTAEGAVSMEEMLPFGRVGTHQYYLASRYCIRSCPVLIRRLKTGSVLSDVTEYM